MKDQRLTKLSRLNLKVHRKKMSDLDHIFRMQLRIQNQILLDGKWQLNTRLFGLLIFREREHL